MSTKHNTAHPERARSRYRLRLSKRGLSKSPEMTPLDTLRRVQDNRIKATCTETHEHTVWGCDGHPWWTSRAEDITSDA